MDDEQQKPADVPPSDPKPDMPNLESQVKTLHELVGVLNRRLMRVEKAVEHITPPEED